MGQNTRSYKYLVQISAFQSFWIQNGNLKTIFIVAAPQFAERLKQMCGTMQHNLVKFLGKCFLLLLNLDNF